MKRWESPTGGTLAWREAGSGPPLVLLHGWSMSGEVFAEMLPLLAKRFRVLAPDLPGHGGSAPLDTAGLGGLAAELAAWLEALGCRQAVLAGWSLGGQVALKLAQVPSLQIRRLVLVATTPRFVAGPDWSHGLPETQVRALARNLRRRYEATLGEFFTRQFTAGELAPQRLREILAFAVRPSPLPPPETALAMLEILRCSDLRGELETVGCPVLVHQGDGDPITVPGAGAALAAGLPQARLVTVPGVGHAPFLSRPGQSARIWEEFLA